MQKRLEQMQTYEVAVKQQESVRFFSPEIIFVSILKQFLLRAM